MEKEYSRISLGKESGAAAWETIYCALVLILVAFFAMLASYSKTETKKIEHIFQKQVILEDPDISAALSVKSLKRYFKKIGLEKSVRIKIEKEGRGFRATFESHVFFPSGLATINKEAYPCLDEMIKIVRKENLSVRVEGHTDNVPINTPEFPSNWELSTSRAVNVLRYLLDRGGLSTQRLSAVGFGRYHPVESNDTPEGRRKNRRVEFYFQLYS
ncbi:MAG: hypothetical protein DRH26_00150 [Deltaproteobacteria bacterium]|nr:MAG: hypothetical protein DRH26_00150 [Deltaproteobacteria bacterium]